MRFHVKSPLLCLILAANLVACSDSGNGPANEQSVLNGEISGQASRLPNGLGQGFESDTQTLKANCITGDLVYAGGPAAEVNYTQDVTYDEVLDNISGGLNVGVGINIFDIKGAADFASKEASDAFSSTITLTSTAAVKSAVLQNIRLTDLGKAMAKDGQVSEAVRKNCGDEFVSQIDYSAKLFINTKFRFNSAQDRLEFKGSASMSLLGIGELGGNISKLSDNLKKNSSVSITAKQIGGNPENLSKILDDSVISCNLADFEAKCLPMLKALVKYAREDFPASLAQDPVPTSSKGWAEILYKTDKYSDHPILSGSDVVTFVPQKNDSLLTREIEQARNNTYDEYEKQMTAYVRASDLLRDFPLDDSQREKVTAVMEATAQNRKSLANVGEICLKTPTSCIEQFEKYKANAVAFDERNLSTKVCLSHADIADSKWSFGRTNGDAIGTIILAANGKILESGHTNETKWAVEGCILRFYSDKNIVTTTFDIMANKEHLIGNYYAKDRPDHTLARIK